MLIDIHSWQWCWEVFLCVCVCEPWYLSMRIIAGYLLLWAGWSRWTRAGATIWSCEGYSSTGSTVWSRRKNSARVSSSTSTPTPRWTHRCRGLWPTSASALLHLHPVLVSSGCSLYNAIWSWHCNGRDRREGEGEKRDDIATGEREGENAIWLWHCNGEWGRGERGCSLIVTLQQESRRGVGQGRSLMWRIENCRHTLLRRAQCEI